MLPIWKLGRADGAPLLDFFEELSSQLVVFPIPYTRQRIRALENSLVSSGLFFRPDHRFFARVRYFSAKSSAKNGVQLDRSVGLVRE